MKTSIKLIIVISLIYAFASVLAAQSYSAAGRATIKGSVFNESTGPGHPVERIAAPNETYEVGLAANRTITGTVYIDKNGDGRYSGDIDEPVQGAYVTINGNAVISNENGVYVFKNLKAGKTEVVVISARGPECEPVVIDLETRPLTRRAVNIAIRP
jgi:hypothetical protein